MASLAGGGAEQVMATLANGFVASGHRVDFVLGSAAGAFLSQLHPAVRVFDLRRKGVLRSLPGLVRYLRRERPIALLSALSHANVVAIAARRLAGIPVRVVVSERTSLSGVTRHHRGLKDRVVRRIMRLAYRDADAIIAVSEDLAAELNSALDVDTAKIYAVANPIVSDRLFAQAEQTINHPWFKDGAVPVILGVGRLAPEKDFETLLRAFAIIRKTRPVRLLILGEGGSRPVLENLSKELGIAENVELPGFSPNPFPYMRRSKVFVLSSVFEGSPGALVQAMACGTAVVSTDCRTGPAEILEGGRWGRLVPVGDPDRLASAIIAAIEEEDGPIVQERAMAFHELNSVKRYLEILIPTHP